MIPEEKVREVLERVSIVEVVSDYVQLRRAGANHIGLCPFHGEKTPSFNVNPAREIFHCFGCGAGGNAFSFIMKMEGVSFPEAVKLLARKAGVQIEERQLTPVERQAQSERQAFQSINNLSAAYYRSVLEKKPEGATGRNYLERRGVSTDLSAAYGLGFAPDRGQLAQYLKGQGVDLNLAARLGVVRRGDHGWHDQLRNRLVFPIRNAKGEVIAFAGRVLDASLPKYINSPESPLYHKSSVLYGLDLALPAVRVENSVIIVEGYFDHLALYRAGIRNVVATCGTALTTSHAALIKRHAGKVYLLFDGDAAGRKATVRSMELFLEQRIPSYVIALPQGEDPDSFLNRHTVEDFRACMHRARPAFEYFVRSLLAQIPPDSVDSKVRVIDELAPRFRKIADPVERDLYEKEICRLMGISSHAFRKRLGGMEVTSQDMRTATAPQAAATRDARQETLLGLMGRYPEARQEIVSTGLAALFDGPYLELAQLMLETMENSADVDQALVHLPQQIESPELKQILSRLLVSEGHLDDIEWRTVFDHCRRGREKKALGRMKEIAARLAVLEPDSEEYAELLHQADALRTRKSRL